MYVTVYLPVMVTKKEITLVMTVGVVLLFICFIGLFPFAFNNDNGFHKT